MSPIKSKNSLSDDEKLIAKRYLKNERQRKSKNLSKTKDFIAKSLYLEGELNVQQYNSWNLRQKIMFARNGYRFTSTSSKPAIQLL